MSVIQPRVVVEGLGKRYRLQHRHDRHTYTALRDVLTDAIRSPLSWLRSTTANVDVEEFWALKDVSFEVGEGEVLGIVGRNGAGKSTLLKVLSRITEPTEGRAVMHGGVASLLEVGTGFHPELTGRDNIFLNGSILGMPRADIARKFDEIVAFAGVDRFLDTPVKRYSSGMYVRLAFAVAAHLEPDILIVDEVLAVGDAEFQQKCLGKMGEVARSGRTVLFVSHHLATVENLCHRVMLLDRGRVKLIGEPGEVIAAYVNHAAPASVTPLLDRTDREGSGVLRFAEVRLLADDGHAVQGFVVGDDAIFDIQIRNLAGQAHRSVHVSIGINSAMGQRVTTWSTSYAGGDLPVTPASDFVLRVRLPRIALIPGSYTYNLFATVGGDVADWLLPAGAFEVGAGDYFGSGQLPGTRDGTFISDHSFQLT